ncbi:MAG: LptE family protein [Candidatus Omnitrophica bacterium]|nr:LptE family protein [Candidatus Omnitrophota bacterium]
MRNSKQLFLLTFLGIFMSLQGGCGYTQKVTLPGDIKTIYVDTFKNKITVGNVYAYEPGLEVKLTNAVIRRLHQDGNLKVVSREKADAILEGNLNNFDQGGVRFSGLERIEEYRVFLVTAFKLKNQKTGQIFWEEKNFSGDASYFVFGPRAVSRVEAADKAIERLARNIVDRIVEDW